jgi:hypothetical protein
VKYFRFLLFLISVQAFSQTLSPDAQISLLTISPGEELYSTFGHSAIRISDPSQRIDVNFNYGTFNFEAPGFYMKFLRGYLNYQISSYNSYVEMEYWNRSNRLITEQVLNLSQNQKQKLFDFLQNNMKPENREYRYKFFTDNCSTRLRDVLQEACGDSLVFNKNLNPDSTYRQWIDKYAHNNNQEWADFGMDLAIGLGSDKKTGWSDAMFIPDNLMAALDEAYLISSEGKQKLVIQKHNLNQIQPTQKKTGITPSLFFMVVMLLVSVFTGYQYFKKSKSILFDKVLFSILGISGWILLMLWFGTDHGVTRYNQNILWASPLVFPAVYYLGKKQWASWLFIVFTVIFVVGYFYFQFLSPSKFSREIFSIALIILIRIVFLFKNKYIGFTGNKGLAG